MPKFLVDESAGKGVAGELRRLGFDAVYVGDTMKQKIKSRGVILLRLDDERVRVKKECIKKLLDNFSNKIENRFVVVTESSIRLRKL